jgi:DNA polymerase III epsilon subunit-like protein
LIRVIDIEPTGIDPASDAIIEIASVDMVRGGGITNAMGTLVRPGKTIPPGASAIHHFIDEDLKDAPTRWSRGRFTETVHSELRRPAAEGMSAQLSLLLYAAVYIT